GAVISQSPGAGESVEHTTEVDLLVSDGREPAEVLDVVGQNRDEAVAALEGEGLEVQVAEEHSDDVAEGRVISQSPSPGAPELYRGDSVEITVSLGPELIDVPDVVGSQVDEARSALEDAGFRVEVREVLGGFFGTVRSMDPDPGERVRAGTVVTITVV
ncbi:PASTA domain-containing protein, partial [Georgenia sp. 10Sc9-8]|nr:PASTA domain-containing protein [Georgenia halotolerans]